VNRENTAKRENTVKRDHTAKREQTAMQLAMFAGLVLFGVVGRWLQPQWNFTPTAAVAGFAAFWFASPLVAALVPIAVLSISNLRLPDHHGPLMLLAVYAAFCVPLVLGRRVRERLSWPRFTALCLLPAVVFFVTTNFAHWALLNQYPHTWDGLMECYTAAVPFFRDGTLAGDVFYNVVLFGGYAFAVRFAGAASAAKTSSK
jgi:branched-subunit amino acid transport protein